MARKTKRSDGRFEASVFLGYGEGGKILRKRFYGKSQKEADRKKQAFLDRKDQGLEQRDTLHSWIVKWVKTSSNSPAMRRSNEAYAKKLDAALGKESLQDIRMIDITAFAQSMSHYSYSTVKSVKRVTNKIFADAVRNRLTNYNPADGVRWDYATKGSHRALEGWERALILDHHLVHRAGVWALLMLFAGLRRGEALALQWEDIDMDNNVIHVTKAVHFEGNTAVLSTTKTEAGIRDVPLLPQLKDALRAYKGRTGAVCLGATGTPVTTEAAFRRGWESYLNAMENILNDELPFQPGRRSDKDRKDRKKFEVRTHDLRHTFCTMLYNAGVGLKEAQYIMGHADSAMTLEVYTHLDAEKRQSAAAILAKYQDKLSSALSSEIPGSPANTAH